MQPLLDLRNEPTKHSNTNKIKYHLYQSKIPGLLKKYKWYKKARKMFEIVPQGKNDFDPITFIEFAMAINSNFCVIDKMTTISNSADAQILVFKRSMVEKHIQDGDKSQLEYAFRITIGENLNGSSSSSCPIVMPLEFRGAFWVEILIPIAIPSSLFRGSTAIRSSLFCRGIV